MNKRKVLICGAGGNLGKALAKGFYFAGDDVYLIARDISNLESIIDSVKDSALNTLGIGNVGSLSPIASDLGSDNVIVDIKTLLNDNGKFDIVIFNLSVNNECKPSAITTESLNAELNSTLFGLLRVANTVLPSYISDGGSFIVIGSTSSYKASVRYPKLSVQKHAIRSLALSLAKEYTTYPFKVLHYIIDGAISPNGNLSPDYVANNIIKLTYRHDFSDIELVLK